MVRSSFSPGKGAEEQNTHCRFAWSGGRFGIDCWNVVFALLWTGRPQTRPY